jgi:hypothetical protein
VPFQAIRQIIKGKLQMDDAAWMWQSATGRSMNKERAHEDCAAFGDGAGNAGTLLPSFDFVGGEAPCIVRAGDCAKRPVIRVAFVQM